MPDVNFEQTTPKSSSSLKLVLVALGILALVGASAYAGYWYGKQQVPPPPTTPEVSTPPVTEVPEATPPAEADKTAGWKSYTNAKYGYEIRYPADAEVKEFGYPNKDMCFNITYKLTSTTIASPDAGGPGCVRTGYAYETKPKEETVVVGGREYMATGTEEVGQGETLDFHNETFIVKGGLLGPEGKFALQYGSISDKAFTYEDYLANKKYIYQILSTFKFLD